MQSGVSTATVDRVLNGRPGVRQKTIDRVHEAIECLARAPGRPSVVPSIAPDMTVDIVISDGGGFANDVLGQALRQAARSRGIAVRKSRAPRMNAYALSAALEGCLTNGSAGVVVQPLEHPAVRESISRLTDHGIPVVFILTDLPGCDALGYIGLDNRAAGRTAGLLMGRMCPPEGEVAIFWSGSNYRSHEEREMGFRSVLRDEFPDLTVLDAVAGLDDPETIMNRASTLLAQRTNLVGVFNIGGGNRGLERALIDSGRQHEINYIAYNLTPLTRQCLLSGVMDAVIHQDMSRAADMAIDAVFHHATSRTPSIEPIPVEIVMRENMR